MAKGEPLTQNETKQIVQLLSTGKSTCFIAKKLKRDHRTIKKFVTNGSSIRKKSSKSKPKALSSAQVRKLKYSLIKNPNATSKTIFDEAGIPDIPKTTRNVYLRKLGTVKKTVASPPLSKLHHQKRLEWATRYMKQDFTKVLWTDECRATLDGPDGWVLKGRHSRNRMRRQQGGGGIMFWAGLLGNTIVGPFKVQRGVKMNSVNYCSFLTTNFLPWYERLSDEEKDALVFMQDNAPSHASRYSKSWFSDQGIDGSKLMIWPPNSPDLNPIEMLWSLIKRKVYENGKQYSSLNVLWEAVCKACREIPEEQLKNLVHGVDKRLVKVITSKGGRFEHVN